MTINRGTEETRRTKNLLQNHLAHRKSHMKLQGSEIEALQEKKKLELYSTASGRVRYDIGCTSGCGIKDAYGTITGNSELEYCPGHMSRRVRKNCEK
jgi:hypothetical protein